MTIYSLQIFLFTFRSAYKRKTGYTIPAPAMESGLAYITGELARQLDLKAATREKAIPDGDAMFGMGAALHRSSVLIPPPRIGFGYSVP